MFGNNPLAGPVLWFSREHQSGSRGCERIHLLRQGESAVFAGDVPGRCENVMDGLSYARYLRSTLSTASMLVR